MLKKNICKISKDKNLKTFKILVNGSSKKNKTM